MIEKQERILSFGKYKGQAIKYIILTHIGYVMWCLENIHFQLNDEEQSLYDAIAIMIKKYDCQMTFPVKLMYKHIKNRESFDKMETPFFYNNGYISYKTIDKDNQICKSVEKYRTFTQAHKSLSFPELCGGLLHCMNKEIDRAYSNGENDEDVFGI